MESEFGVREECGGHRKGRVAFGELRHDGRNRWLNDDEVRLTLRGLRFQFASDDVGEGSRRGIKIVFNSQQCKMARNRRSVGNQLERPRSGLLSERRTGLLSERPRPSRVIVRTRDECSSENGTGILLRPLRATVPIQAIAGPNRRLLQMWPHVAIIYP